MADDAQLEEEVGGAVVDIIVKIAKQWERMGWVKDTVRHILKIHLFFFTLSVCDGGGHIMEKGYQNK